MTARLVQDVAYAKKRPRPQTGHLSPEKERLTTVKRSTKIASTALSAAAMIALTATSANAAPAVKSLTAKEARVSITSWPAIGTGGLILREINGRDKGSGIGEEQTFGFNGCGPKGSGLIKVVQLTRGKGGGWGSEYAGFVKQKYTQLPSMFPCNGYSGK